MLEVLRNLQKLVVNFGKIRDHVHILLYSMYAFLCVMFTLVIIVGLSANFCPIFINKLLK